MRISELVGSNRLDPEYYQPHYQAMQARLKAIGAKTIDSFADANDGFHESPVWVEDGGIPCISAKCVKDNYFVLTAMGQVSLEQRDKNPTKEARVNDVLLTSVGTIGNCAVVQKEILPAIMDRHVGIIRIRKNADVDPYYLAAFFNSQYGRFQTWRESTGNVQLNLFIEKINKLLVPIGSQFNAIGAKVRTAYDKFRASEQLYAEAERLLSAELGLDRLDLSESLFNVRRVSDVMNAGRVDAEYFKPKYERLLEYLRQTGQAVRLSDEVREPLKRGIQPKYVNDGEILVINSQHVGKTHVELEDNRRTTKDFCADGSNKRAVVQKNDVLMNSTGYITIGRAQTLLENVPAMVDGHVTIIRPKDGLDPIYLGLFLNSQPGQLQTERGWTGSSGQIELRTEVIGNFLVWKAPMPIQLKIRELVENAYQARQDAKRLLAEAKAEVERLVEGR